MKSLMRPLVVAVLLSAFNSVPTLATTVESVVSPPANTEHVSPKPYFLIGQPQTQNSEADALFQVALRLYLEQKYDAALANCLKASALDPNDHRPRAIAGFIYLKQHNLKSASESFAEAIRLQPNMRELYLAKAETDFLRNAREEALIAARKAVEVDPNFAEGSAFLGHLLTYKEDARDEAIRALRTAIKLKPSLPQPYQDLSNIFETAKDLKGAEEVLRQGMAADPKRMAGRFKLGRMLVKQNRLTEARQLWDERTSDEDRTMPKFIEVLNRAENLKRATDKLEQNPNDPEVLVNMGLAVMEGDHWVIDGRQKRALVYFRKALELNPRFARAQYGIVKAYIQGVGPKDESKTLDAELAKLREIDPVLAREMEEYRKTYVSGIRVTTSQ